MPITVQFEGGPPGEGSRPKIRLTLPNSGDASGNGHSPPPASEQEIPARVMRFWNYDEDTRSALTPWRLAESPNEQAIRKQLENNGCWAGL
jgi:hypothetical protein